MRVSICICMFCSLYVLLSAQICPVSVSYVSACVFGEVSHTHTVSTALKMSPAATWLSGHCPCCWCFLDVKRFEDLKLFWNINTAETTGVIISSNHSFINHSSNHFNTVGSTWKPRYRWFNTFSLLNSNGACAVIFRRMYIKGLNPEISPPPQLTPFISVFSCDHGGILKNSMTSNIHQ